MQPRFRVTSVVGVVVLAAVLVVPFALAAFTAPNTFANGTVASADSVNANFAAVGTELTLAMNAEHGTWQKVAGVSGYAPYFTTQYANTLSSLGTVTNDATNGWSFTAARKVKVTMNVTLAVNGGGGWHAITINADRSQPYQSATNLSKTVASEYESINTGAVSLGWAGILQPNDVIRPHSNTTSLQLNDLVAGIVSILVEPVN